MIEPAAGPHGGDGWRIAAQLGLAPGDLLDLSASLNPVAPDPGPIVERHLDALGRYPDDEAATHRLAAALGVGAERVVLTNGGAEAIALVAAERQRGSIVEPEFSLYRHHLLAVSPDAGRWLSDPNNPTGRLVAPDLVADVRDEAFYPLATARWTRGDERTTVVGSLTKLFACPGLRLGYIIGRDREEAERLRAMRPRWAVNGLACEAVGDFLDLADLHRWRYEIAELRTDLVGELHRRGWDTTPSDVNYVWLPDAPGLRSALVAEGILVRSGASFGHDQGVRIAVPAPKDIDRLIAGLPARHEGTPL